MDQDTVHAEKMQRIKKARDKMMAKKIDQKGLLIVHTGNGKGKSSSAFGMVMRCLGHGKKVGIVQFIKGAWETGEEKILKKFPELCHFHAMGAGFTWETQNKKQDIALAEKAWEKACSMLSNPSYDMVVMDEINVVLRYHFLSLETVLKTLKKYQNDQQHVVMTGRHAHGDLIEQADLVTEMTCVKHPFRQQGVKAQKGVEY